MFHDPCEEGYKEGVKQLRGAKHIAEIHLTNQRADNNVVERVNGTTRERHKTARGVKKADGIISRGSPVYNNHARPHTSLGGKTPAEAAGVGAPRRPGEPPVGRPGAGQPQGEPPVKDGTVIPRQDRLRSQGKPVAAKASKAAGGGAVASGPRPRCPKCDRPCPRLYYREGAGGNWKTTPLYWCPDGHGQFEP